MYYNFFIVLLSYHMVLGDRSFTLVLDTSESMQDEIDVIKANIGPVVDFIGNQSYIGSYIIVPFKDPDVGPPIVKLTTKELTDSLGTITASGGIDCPENSMAGIKMALEISKPESFIFVFTDADAKDYSKFHSIAELCRSTRSQVNIFLSGSCVQSRNTQGNLNIYYDITKACLGSVFRFDFANLRQGFKYIKEITKIEWTDIATHDVFTEYKQFTFSIDSFTSDFVVAVSGQNAVLQIVDAHSKVPAIEKIIDTKYSLVARFVKPEVGDYTIDIRCQGVTSLTLYRKNELPFQVGFCTRMPKSMKETSTKPMPGWTNYILIQVKSTVKLHSLEIHVLGANEITVLKLQVHNSGLYTATVFIQPEKYFRISIKGEDTTNYEQISGTTKVLVPQKSDNNVSWIQPSIEIIEPESNFVDFGSNVTIPCKVKGYPKPEMWWEDESGNKLLSEYILLEIPSVYINYVIIENATANSTLYCKCKNTVGETSQSMDLLVKRTFSFDVILTPTDETFEYGTAGKLYCKVNAYPEAVVEWYHNGTLLESYDSRKKIGDNSLTIKNMSLEDVGSYTCKATNTVESKSFNANVLISGIEAPEVEVEKSEIVLMPGDWRNIECRILKGKPTPEITWKYQLENDYNLNHIPDGVYVDDGKLKIPSAKIEHRGVYKCEGVNFVGQSTSEVTIKVNYAPIINNNEDKTVTVTEGDPVELICDVDAAPKATVRWEMSQDDLIIPFDDRHSTDDRHSHRFDALWKDSGNYHCFAENSMGTAEKTIKLIVLVDPYIENPKETNITVNDGADVTLLCNVLFGNPVPTTKWEFIAKDSTITVLSRGNSKNTLQLKKVTRVQEGLYQCIAENKVRTDSIKVYLRVL